MEYDDVLDEGEVVCWEGRPRQRRIFALGDLVMVPFSLVWTGFAVVIALDLGAHSWLTTVLLVSAGAYLTIGRFIAKAILKARTTYLVTDRRALVLRRRAIYEHQELEGITPEITGWNRNRIVTFGDVLESTLAGSTSLRHPGGNLGLSSGWFGVRRGDGSPFPIRFYDLDTDDAERLMAMLRGPRR